MGVLSKTTSPASETPVPMESEYPSKRLKYPWLSVVSMVPLKIPFDLLLISFDCRLDVKINSG